MGRLLCPVWAMMTRSATPAWATTSRYTHARPGDGVGTYLPI